MTSQNQDKLLLRLSLEFAISKEPIAVVDSFVQYLKERFSPEKIDFFELEGHEDKFEGEKIFLESKDGRYFLLPLTLGKVFLLKKSTTESPSDEELSVISLITKAFREKHEAMLELKGLTYTDDITGLYNQRYMELILDREMALAKRNETPFAVLFLDLDHFKNVNDKHGHLIGSRLLYEVGAEIKKALRESDITFRYGGDEFVMLLANTNLEDAMIVAERVRVCIEKKRFLARDHMDLRLTASIGVASFPQHALTKDEILRAADEALYKVKKEVRNKVTSAKVRPGGTFF